LSLLVLDASIVGPLVFEDERSGSTQAIEQLIASHDCLTTAHWRLEVANLILMGVRRGRALVTEADEAFALLDGLGLIVDTETGARAWSDSYQLASAHQLTIYDAGYLELAKRASAGLISLDRRLVDAARKHAIAVPVLS
jgi:predicted nucleic acid-binding protein